MSMVKVDNLEIEEQIAEANIVEVKENIVILDRNLDDGEYTYSIDEKKTRRYKTATYSTTYFFC